MPIGIEMLISEGTPYFSPYRCKMLGPKDVALSDTYENAVNCLKRLVTTISELSLHFRL